MVVSFRTFQGVTLPVEPSTEAPRGATQRRDGLARAPSDPLADLSLRCFLPWTNGGFHKWGYPKIDGLQWKILFKWMMSGYHPSWETSK